MAPHPTRRWLSLLIAIALFPTSAGAQIQVGPVVTIPAELPSGWDRPSTTFGVVGGDDGRAFVLWTERYTGGSSTTRPRNIVTRVFDPATAIFEPLVRTPITGREPDVAVSAASGSFFAGWSAGRDSQNKALFGRTFAADGSARSAIATLADEFPEDGGVETIAASADAYAHVVAWSLRTGVFARRVGRDGSAGIEVEVDPLATARSVAVASTIDGGFVVGYGGPVFVRGFSAIGVPKSAVVGLTGDSDDVLHALVASPVEDLVVALIVEYEPSHNGPYPIVLRRFHSDGTLLGPAIPVADLPTTGHADAVFDRNGNLYVAWASFTSPLRVQAYYADGTPAGPVYEAPAATGPTLQSARLANGDFINVWRNGQAFQYNVISLCMPGSAICGDGVLDTFCERCDTGLGNSDTTPDACRTDCELPRCGDGTIDAGEGCDDGNTTDCDGCSGECVLEAGLGCGDGVPYPSCGEACDDGNTTAGDGCASCVLERGLGGGSAKTDCFTAWSIDNPANEPRYAKSGAISDAQICTDGDTRCDFDGGVVGSCTFHVRVCANNTHLPTCNPGTRLSSWDLRTPSAAQAATRPSAAAVRNALQSVVPGNVVGTSQHDACSPIAAIPVPLRGSPGAYANGRVTVKTLATLYDGRKDNDKLRLECRP